MMGWFAETADIDWFRVARCASNSSTMKAATNVAVHLELEINEFTAVPIVSENQD